MSKKFLSYIATDLTNMLKLPKGKPTSNMGFVRYFLPYCIGFSNFLFFRIYIIFLFQKCYCNIFKKVTMIFTVNVFKQMLLHTYLLPRIFPNINFVIQQGFSAQTKSWMLSHSYPQLIFESFFFKAARHFCKFFVNTMWLHSKQRLETKTAIQKFISWLKIGSIQLFLGLATSR